MKKHHAFAGLVGTLLIGAIFLIPQASAPKETVLISHADGSTEEATAARMPWGTVYTFSHPIDALSIGVPSDDIRLMVSTYVRSRWTEWEPLELEKEFDPMLRESNLVMFPEPVSAVRVMGETTDYALHPVRVSHEPARVEVAATTSMKTPRILSRSQWGADESLLIAGPSETRSDTGDNGDVAVTDTSGRAQDCLEAQKLYPNEFKSEGRRTENSQGEPLRWAQEYSPSIKMLVVHHTAIKITGDPRPGIERMRALYTYHANNRGWGDIGYHYVVDEAGQIYEGRAGGDNVVGGHAYCANVGTVGVVLMGNFDEEKPSQMQMQSLKWLLVELGKKYSIDLKRDVKFHGKTLPAIVGHKDVVSTACPGYYVRETLGQVRSHVQKGKLDSPIVFPTMQTYQDRTQERRASRGGSVTATVSPTSPVLSAVGPTNITGRPGGQASFLMRITAGTQGLSQRSRIATVTRSDTSIGLWQMIGSTESRVRYELLLPKTLKAGASDLIQVRVQFPDTDGTHTLQFGNLTYRLTVEGRRTRTPVTSPVSQSTSSLPRRIATSPPAPSITSVPTARPTVTRSSSTPAAASTHDPLIRIRLSFAGDTTRVSFSDALRLNAIGQTTRNVDLRKNGTTCVASINGKDISTGIVRMEGGISTINDWDTLLNRFRGVIECRVIDGALVLINELPLETYLEGLAEEPDTEPYEKQRAFAIAARSYAAHYLNPKIRKFPGMPYDGDDSPARFQKYGGVGFEEGHTRWVQAVRSTRGIVVKKDGDIVKTAYFSSDDGRTRAPSEVGWGSYPHAEVFVSKPDPWCNGFPMAGHGVGMSGCGSEGQANEGKSAEEILRYYYEGAELREIVE